MTFLARSPIAWMSLSIAVLNLGNISPSLASRRQNSVRNYNRFASRSRTSVDLLTSALLPLTRKKEEITNNVGREMLLPRGGDVGVVGGMGSTATETIEPNADDVKLKSLDRLKSDPSSIPIDNLLSNQYLNVPTTGNGKILLGLTQSDRDSRLKFHGPNELEQPPERSLISYVIEQFDDKLVRILLAVALVSGLFGLLEVKEEMSEWTSHWMGRILQVLNQGKKARIPLSSSSSSSQSVTTIISDSEASNSEVIMAQTHQFSIRHILEALIEPIVITTILIINALVGGYQSLNASKGISALTQMQAQKAVVKLNSGESDNSIAGVEEIEVDSHSLVPGDVVVLTVGQKIPADIRLVSVSTSSFTVDEACLTGESDSVAKMPYRGDSSNAENLDRGVGSMGAHSKGMLYGGTVITAGKGVGVVVRTGMDTEMGKVRLYFYVLMCFI